MNTNDWEFDNDEDSEFDDDEIAKIYAQKDMESQKQEWAREQALKFYDDFETLDINEAVLQINCLIADKTLTNGHKRSKKVLKRPKILKMFTLSSNV